MPELTIRAEYDREAKVCYTVEGDVEGLFADAETLEQLEQKVAPMIVDLLELQGRLNDEPIQVRIIAHHERPDVAA